MKSDTALRCAGMRVLSETLGVVEAERFITVILREQFDYTKWRQDLFKNEPLETFLEDAMSYRKSMQEENSSIKEIAGRMKPRKFAKKTVKSKKVAVLS